MSESLPTTPDSHISDNSKKNESDSGIKEETSNLHDNSQVNIISQNNANAGNINDENSRNFPLEALNQPNQVIDQSLPSNENADISTNHPINTEPVNEIDPQTNEESMQPQKMQPQKMQPPTHNIVETIIASPHRPPALSADASQKESYQIAFRINEVSIEPTKDINKSASNESLPDLNNENETRNSFESSTTHDGYSNIHTLGETNIAHHSSDLDSGALQQQNDQHHSPSEPQNASNSSVIENVLNLENTPPPSSSAVPQQPIQEDIAVPSQQSVETSSSLDTPSTVPPKNDTLAPPENSSSLVAPPPITESIQHSSVPPSITSQPPVISSPPIMASSSPVISSPPISNQPTVISSPPIAPSSIISSPPSVISSPPQAALGAVVVKHSGLKSSAITQPPEFVQTRRFVSTTPPHQPNQHFIQHIQQPQQNQSGQDLSQISRQQQPPPLIQQQQFLQQQPPMVQQPPLAQQQPTQLPQQQQLITQPPSLVQQQSVSQQPSLGQQPSLAQQSFKQQPPLSQQLHQACISPSQMQMQQMQPLQTMQSIQQMHTMQQMQQMQPFQMQQMQPPLHPQHIHQMKQMQAIQPIQPLQQIQSPPPPQQQIHQMQQMQPLQQLQQQHVQNMQQMQQFQQINQMNQISQINQMNQMNQINQMNQMAQMNQINQIGQINQKNQKTSINNPNQFNQMNQIGQMNQIDTQQNIIQNYKLQKPTITPAAPYPSLPSSQQVQEALREIEEQLEAQKAELNHLEHVQKRGIIKLADYRNRSPQLRVQYYKGFIVPHEMVNVVKEQSQSRATASKSMYLLSTEQNGVTFSHVTDLPYLRDQITRNDDVAEPMMLTLKDWKLCALEKARLLTRQYVEKHWLWEQLNGPLNRYNHESRKSIDLWPSEFKNSVPENTLVRYCANDEPMYLDEMEKNEYVFYDMNRFVEDPVAEHLAYKRRLIWTDAEIKIFLERYAQHPREFKRIAASLPSKCVKDVIEFYDIHRIDLNLKDIEVASRKKGQRKKMVSEGSVRK